MINITGSSASQPGYYYFFTTLRSKQKCFNTTGIDSELITHKSLEYIFCGNSNYNSN